MNIISGDQGGIPKYFRGIGTQADPCTEVHDGNINNQDDGLLFLG